jgi:hypothetical protein
MNPIIQIVSSAPQAETAELVAAFAEDLQKNCTAPQVILIDSPSGLDSFPNLDRQPVVLLNADRAEVMDLLARFPLAAAVEKYALFAWWRKRGRSNGAFWLHGSARVARRMGSGVQVCGLYSTEDHCAFGSASHSGLPGLLALYLETAVGLPER